MTEVVDESSESTAAAPAAGLPTVSIVVPAYNEALVIMRSLTTLCEYLHTLDDRYTWELVVVDDGSTDETGAIADAFASSRAEVRVLHHQRNWNLGQALKYAFGTCKGDYVVTFDSDLSYSPDHIERLLTALRQDHARIAIASPYMKGGKVTGVPWRRKVMSRWANRLLGAAAKGDLSTVTGMVRAYDRPFLATLNLKALGPEVNTEILYKAQILRAHIVEIPAHLDWSEQTERMATRGAPSLRVKQTTSLQIFSSFLFRPLTFFVIPGLLLGLLAVWTLGSVAISVIHQYAAASGTFDNRLTDAFAATYQERPQSFIIGGVSLVLSVQLVSLGILSLQAKRYFEELFHLGTHILREEIRS